METPRLEPHGFALVLVLVLLATLFAGAAGIFAAARAELLASVNQARAELAFHAVEGGIASWLADPVQPATGRYRVGEFAVRVDASQLLAVDSVTSLYLIVGQVDRDLPDPAPASSAAYRRISLLGLRTAGGRVEPVARTRREHF